MAKIDEKSIAKLKALFQDNEKALGSNFSQLIDFFNDNKVTDNGDGTFSVGNTIINVNDIVQEPEVRSIILSQLKASPDFATKEQLDTKADTSAVVHNTGNEEIGGQKTFDMAPIDKTTGNPYITKSGVPTVDLSSYATNSQLATKADDSKVVHTKDMRKPASDVAGIEEVNAKQDKIGYTPADDSKVVHTTDTSNWQKQAMFNPGSYRIDSTTDLATLLRSKYNKPGVVYIRDSASIVDAVVISEGVGWWYAYGVKSSGGFVYRTIRESDDTGWIINADDSKVAHLSGANNFDTVPTVDNNPLLLASSLPSDLARTGQDVNFTGKLQKSGIDVATTTDVTNAVSGATSQVAHLVGTNNFTGSIQHNGNPVGAHIQASNNDEDSAISDSATGNSDDIYYWCED